MKVRKYLLPPLGIGLAVTLACLSGPKSVQDKPRRREREEGSRGSAGRDQRQRRPDARGGPGDLPLRHLRQRSVLGRELRLHEAILGEKNGGVGAGLTAEDALKLGLKVDIGKLPKLLGEVLKAGQRQSRRARRPRSSCCKRRCRRRRQGHLRQEDKNVTAIGITLRALPLHRRRFLHEGDRPAAGRLAQPRPRTSARSWRWRRT